MAEYSSFFDSFPGSDGQPDRSYNAKHFLEHFSAMVTDGVVKNYTDNLDLICDNATMATVLKPGMAYVDMHMYKNNADKQFIHDVETAGKSRIDLIILRLDLNDEARYIKSFVLKGTAAPAPTLPELTKNESIYEIPLYSIKIVGGQSFIASSNVTDLREWASTMLLPNFSGTGFREHLESTIESEQGAHGLRFFNDLLQFKTSNGWLDIETGGAGNAPRNLKNFSAQADDGAVKITWTDPDDYDANGKTVKWAGTKIVRKVGSYPDDAYDGTLVIDSKIKNQYESTPFEDTGLENGIIYYYQAFPYSTQKAINKNEENRLQATPKGVPFYGIKIDQNNSNPTTSVTYTGLAKGVTPGISSWENTPIFSKIKPCLFENGSVIGYLQKNDFTKFENGSAAPINTFNADVMIEFPRIGIKVIDGDKDTFEIRLTLENDETYNYDAFMTNTGVKEKLYIGAYKGILHNNKLRSVSYTDSGMAQGFINPEELNMAAGARGNGFRNYGSKEHFLLQCLFLLMFKSRDSRRSLGLGKRTDSIGSLNKHGMYYGSPTDYTIPVKFCGLESFWDGSGTTISNLRAKGKALDRYNYEAYLELDGEIENATLNDQSGMGVKKMNVSEEFGFMPSELGASTSTGYTSFCNFGETSVYDDSFQTVQGFTNSTTATSDTSSISGRGLFHFTIVGKNVSAPAGGYFEWFRGRLVFL